MLLNNDLGIADVADCIVVSMRPDFDEGMQQLMQALPAADAGPPARGTARLLRGHAARSPRIQAGTQTGRGAPPARCRLPAGGLECRIAAFLALADAELRVAALLST